MYVARATEPFGGRDHYDDGDGPVVVADRLGGALARSGHPPGLGRPRRIRDAWAERAQEFHHRLVRRWAEPDPIRDFVRARIAPRTTVLDIGAGPGAWSILLVRTAARVTAIDASPAMRTVMRTVMRASLATAAVANVDLLPGRWPDLDIRPHDYGSSSE